MASERTLDWISFLPSKCDLASSAIMNAFWKLIPLRINSLVRIPRMKGWVDSSGWMTLMRLMVFEILQVFKDLLILGMGPLLGFLL